VRQLTKNPHCSNDVDIKSASGRASVGTADSSLRGRYDILADAVRPQVDEQPLGNLMTLISG